MLTAVMMIASMTAQSSTASPNLQIFAGRDFEALVRDTQARCPGVPVRYLKPADLLDLEEQFNDGLAPAKRRRLKAFVPLTPHGGVARCADVNGASCDAIANLEGYRRSGLRPAFTRFVCAPGRVR